MTFDTEPNHLIRTDREVGLVRPKVRYRPRADIGHLKRLAR